MNIEYNEIGYGYSDKRSGGQAQVQYGGQQHQNPGDEDMTRLQRPPGVLRGECQGVGYLRPPSLPGLIQYIYHSPDVHRAAGHRQEQKQQRQGNRQGMEQYGAHVFQGDVSESRGFHQEREAAARQGHKHGCRGDLVKQLEHRQRPPVPANHPPYPLQHPYGLHARSPFPVRFRLLYHISRQSTTRIPFYNFHRHRSHKRKPAILTERLIPKSDLTFS